MKNVCRTLDLLAMLGANAGMEFSNLARSHGATHAMKFGHDLAVTQDVGQFAEGVAKQLRQRAVDHAEDTLQKAVDAVAYTLLRNHNHDNTVDAKIGRDVASRMHTHLTKALDLLNAE